MTDEAKERRRRRLDKLATFYGTHTTMKLDYDDRDDPFYRYGDTETARQFLRLGDGMISGSLSHPAMGEVADPWHTRARWGVYRKA